VGKPVEKAVDGLGTISCKYGRRAGRLAGSGSISSLGAPTP